MSKQTNKILIDATYPEQTRLAIIENGHLENYDQEVANNKTLKGNIYLAKVTRVEPSLQACFVDYGRERHGFLSLTEIHPDYYRIPTADKKILMEDFYREQEREQEWQMRGGRDNYRGRRSDRRGRRHDQEEGQEYSKEQEENSSAMARENNGRGRGGEYSEDYRPPRYGYGDQEGEAPHGAQSDLPPSRSRGASADDMEDEFQSPTNENEGLDGGDSGEANRHEADGYNQNRPSSVGKENEMDEEDFADEQAEGEDQDDADGENIDRSQMSRFVKRRRYKIQEVIKKGQVILVQVVKDERGQKGAAMTSYLSLAGRYCVLMPNTTKGGGISRKVSMAERDHLRSVMRELNIPKGMGLIIRTAGADRSQDEIKADYEYLLKLWDHIREVTVASEAPLLIYDEGSLVKKAIRNYNNSNIDEIWIEGEEAFATATETMKAIAPAEVGKLKKYLPRDHKNRNIFNFHDIEYEIQSIYEPYVPLRSGGMLVINQTEALVAIDVNSGKAIRERNIEETALRTNLEAAAEVARQLRLRDLSGQIVVDFIDMEYNRNIYQVESYFREQLRQDKARIQVGRIGMFGMLEMTRQRLRPSITETVMQDCPHCRGSGKSFRPEYYSLQFLRELFNLVQEKGPGKVVAEVPTELVKDLLSNKREKLNEIEDVYKVDLEFVDLPAKSLEPYIINYGKGSKKTASKPAGRGRGKKPLDFISAATADGE